jgi:hypothetical protein
VLKSKIYLLKNQIEQCDEESEALMSHNLRNSWVRKIPLLDFIGVADGD